MSHVRLRALLLGLTVLLVQACASTTGTRERHEPEGQGPRGSAPPRIGEVLPAPPAPAPVPVEPVPLEPPPAPPPPDFPRSAEQISGQAVTSLMRKAADARKQGQYDLAAAQLERAQRIEPRNYFLWSALARVYLDQQQYDQAISVASKSNSLARGNVYAELENWKIIAGARRAQGDSLGALQAQARIEEIQRQLGGS